MLSLRSGDPRRGAGRGARRRHHPEFLLPRLPWRLPRYQRGGARRLLPAPGVAGNGAIPQGLPGEVPGQLPRPLRLHGGCGKRHRHHHRRHPLRLLRLAQRKDNRQDRRRAGSPCQLCDRQGAGHLRRLAHLAGADLLQDRRAWLPPPPLHPQRRERGGAKGAEGPPLSLRHRGISLHAAHGLRLRPLRGILPGDRPADEELPAALLAACDHAGRLLLRLALSPRRLARHRQRLPQHGAPRRHRRPFLLRLQRLRDLRRRRGVLRDRGHDRHSDPRGEAFGKRGQAEGLGGDREADGALLRGGAALQRGGAGDG